MEPRAVSVAVPLYNEEEILPELLRRLEAVLDEIPGGPHEVILVNDGSTDGTWELVRKAARGSDRVTGVSLSRNFGHQIALTAALDRADGDAVVLMDGDLQDPPEAIPTLLEKMDEGNDVVYAVRESRTAPWLKRQCYRWFYRITSALSPIPIPLDAGDFSAVSSRVVRDLRGLRERHRFVRGLRAWVGYRQAGVPLHRPDRESGESKYGWSRLMGLALDGLLSFSVVPLRAAAALGLVTIGITAGYALWALIERLFLGGAPRGFTGLIVTIVFLAGVQLLFLGVVGEYVGRVYEEVKSRPLYLVEETTAGSAGFGKGEGSRGPRPPA